MPETDVQPVDSFKIAAAVEHVVEELTRATEKFGPFHSSHEGYAVILEEMDELWEEVKAGNREAAQKEAIQVAAMAMRFLIDCEPGIWFGRK